MLGVFHTFYINSIIIFFHSLKTESPVGEKNLAMKTLHPSEVPTIDFNDLSSHNSETSSLIVAKTIHQACQEMGFFQVTKRAHVSDFDGAYFH